MTESINSSDVLLESIVNDSILLLEINRPEVRNALSSQVFGRIRDVLRKAEFDTAIRVVILTGRGENFAAGSDIKEFDEHTGRSIQSDERELIWREITNFSKPIVGAVVGYCFGGGCELAMHCDILVAGESAKFAQPEINLGLMPGAGGTQRLPKAVGKSLAMQMALTGKPVDAGAACRSGLVSEVVSDSDLMERAIEIATEISEKSPIAVRYAKQAVLNSFDQGLTTGLLSERKSFYMLFSTEDKQEGFTAFKDKRKPSFRGS